MSEKLDVLDLIIATLREQEDRLDSLAYRFERLLDHFEHEDDVTAFRRFYR